MALGRGFPPPSAIVNVNHNPRAWICQGRKMRFFSRLQAAELARAGRRPHACAQGNGWGQRLLDAVGAAVLAAVGGLGVGDGVGLATGCWGYWVGHRRWPPPPSENDGLVGATGWWGAGCGLTGGCRNYVMADSSENAKMQKLPFPEFA